MSEYSSGYLPCKKFMYSDANPLPFNYLNLFSLESFRMINEYKNENEKEKEKLFFDKNIIINNYLDASYAKCVNYPPHVNM